MRNLQTYPELIQGTEEWMQIRAGRVTGSTCQPLFTGDGTNLLKGAQSLLYKMVGESIAGPELDTYTSAAMEHGNEWEPIAREIYEEETWSKVDQVGFIASGDLFGCSPDGLIGSDGSIEIKCPQPAEWVRFFHERTTKPEHQKQIDWLLWITGRAWCDLVYYHPELGIITKRQHADQTFDAVRTHLDRITEVYTSEFHKLKQLIKNERK